MAKQDAEKPAASVLIGGGTLDDGVGFASSEEPENKHITMLRKAGYKGCVVLRPGAASPDWYIEWLVKEANSWHGGSAWTIVECYEDSARAAQLWKVYALGSETRARITVDGSPPTGPYTYMKQMEAFIFDRFDPPVLL